MPTGREATLTERDWTTYQIGAFGLQPCLKPGEEEVEVEAFDRAICWKWKSNLKNSCCFMMVWEMVFKSSSWGSKNLLSIEIPGDHSPNKRLGWPMAHVFRTFRESSSDCQDLTPPIPVQSRAQQLLAMLVPVRACVPTLVLYTFSHKKTQITITEGLGTWSQSNISWTNKISFDLIPPVTRLFLPPLCLRQILAHYVCKWSNCKLAWWGRSGKAQALLRPAAAGTSPWFCFL